ncbi:MAG: hypothetical protein WEB90_02270 [Gemmatimonadota bacterium]
MRRLLTLCALALAVVVAAPVAAQVVDGDTGDPPVELARGFLRSLRSLHWEGAAQALHPETLDRFRVLVSAIAAADSTGGVGRFLTGAAPERFDSLDPERVFARAIGAMLGEMPGLAHAIQDRDDEVLGTVPEGADAEHAVYRTQARIGGSVSEVKVMELGRVGAGWRVRWSDELEVLDAALRGVAMGPRPRES